MTSQTSAAGKCGCRSDGAATTVDELRKRTLSAPGTIVRRWNEPDGIRGFEIVAGPGQPLSSPPRAGDILIHIIDGGGRHASRVASEGVIWADEIKTLGLRADTEPAEGFVLTEDSSLPSGSSERYRGITDRGGRLLEDLLLLRLATQPPTVIRVEQPASIAPTQNSSNTPTVTEDSEEAIGEAGENIESDGDSDSESVASHEGAVGVIDFVDRRKEPDRSSGDSPETASEDPGGIGSEGRARITPTTDPPFRWICHVAVRDAGGRCEKQGSGILISDRHVLTAAHTVWDAARDPESHFLQVRPGIDQDNEPFDSWSAATVRVCSNFDASDAANQEWDYALVTLEAPIGKRRFKSIQSLQLRYWGAADFGGNFSMGPGDPRTLGTNDVLSAGYPGGKGYDKELWLTKGRIRDVSPGRWPNSLFTTLEPGRGQSGSPVWIKEGELFLLVGIVVDSSAGAGIARRATAGMIQELSKWIAEDKETAWMRTAAEVPEGDDEWAIGNSLEENDSEVACEHIDATHLSWPGATAQQLDLLHTVYLRQVTAACRHRSFVGDVPDSELDVVEKGQRLRRPAAERCRALLLAAHMAMSADSAARNVTLIEVASGYRSARRQFANWNRGFPRYFSETREDRAAAAGGEYGQAAASLLARYIGRRLAAPGFSLHNDGRAVDFRTVEGGTVMGVGTDARNRSNWRTSWFFGWLSANAGGYGFFQNTAIDEPWHWEYRDTVTAATQSIETIDPILSSDTVEPSDQYGAEGAEPVEFSIVKGRSELSHTPLLASHRGTQPDLILRWNDMTDATGVDTVLHLHGYSSDRERMRLRRKEAYSGLDFSNPDNPSDPRAGRSAPTLCVLPRGSYTGDSPGANPERYSFPALSTPSKVRNFLDYCLGQFQSAAGVASAVSSRRLIITAHSGGGAALMRILANNSNNDVQIDEIQVFDALYGPALANAVKPLVSWVKGRIAAEIQSWTSGKARADGGICVLYRSGTERQSRMIQDAIQAAIATAPSDAQPVLSGAYRVRRTAVGHGDIPRRFGWRLLADMAQVFPESGGMVE